MIWIFDMLEWCRGFIPNTANTVLCVNTPYAYGSLPEETLTIEHSKCSSTCVMQTEHLMADTRQENQKPEHLPGNRFIEGNVR